MENQEFIKGKIINYNKEKSFGFIETAEKGNVFFHQSKLEKGKLLLWNLYMPCCRA